jgi:Holliday junction resolvase
MEELFFRKKKLFKKNSHVYITKYKITDLFFFSRRFIDHLFINKRVPVVEYVDCSWLVFDPIEQMVKGNSMVYHV